MRCVALLSGGFPEEQLREAGGLGPYRDPAHLVEEFDLSPLGAGGMRDWGARRSATRPPSAATHPHTGTVAPVQLLPNDDDGDRAPDAGVTEEMKRATGSENAPHTGGNASG